MPCTVTEEIPAPIEEVFRLFTDVEKCCKIIENITKIEIISEVAKGKGLRWKETREIDLGRFLGKQSSTEEMEVVDYEENSYFVAVAESCGCEYRSIFSFKSLTVDITEVSLTVSSTPMSYCARFMNFFMGSSMDASVTSCIQKDLTEVRNYYSGDATEEKKCK